MTKTTGLWLGKWKDRSDTPCGFNWVSDKLKILGIYFGNEITPEVNWCPNINQIKHAMETWKNRNLTLKGKAIINTMVGAGLTYLGSVLPCPNDLVKKIDNILWDFYWNGSGRDWGNERQTKTRKSEA